jgi:hypothetical protein
MATWIIETDETFDEMVERIAKARFEAPCADEGNPCNPDLHVWATGHPDDKAWGRDYVRFVLEEVGFGG